MLEILKFWSLILLIVGFIYGIGFLLKKKFSHFKMMRFSMGILWLLLSVLLFIVGRFFIPSNFIDDIGYYVLSFVFSIISLTSFVLAFFKTRKEK